MDIDIDKAKTLIPEDHQKFLSDLYDYIVTDKYYFVHAGFNPGIENFLNTSKESLYWIREYFITSDRDFGKTVIYGHSAFKDGISHQFPHKIGIDTGCVYKGFLSCIELPSMNEYSLHRGANTVIKKQSPTG
jgi:serine/threonine protein phosphatase 1